MVESNLHHSGGVAFCLKHSNCLCINVFVATFSFTASQRTLVLVGKIAHGGEGQKSNLNDDVFMLVVEINVYINQCIYNTSLSKHNITLCPLSLDPFKIACYYINLVETSWTYSSLVLLSLTASNSCFRELTLMSDMQLVLMTCLKKITIQVILCVQEVVTRLI